MQFKDPMGTDRPGFRTRMLWQYVLPAALLLWGFTSPLQADITLTQLANAGILVSDGETRIIIDGMVVEPYAVYGGLPSDVIPMFEQLSGPFADIDLVLVSHRHHEHNQPRYACRFLQQSLVTRFVSSPQVNGLMREKCRTFMTSSPRVQEINPPYGEPHIIELPGARVTVFPLSHGARKYAGIQNFGQLVEMGGMTVLHIGDAAMNPEDFARAGLDQIKIDVVVASFRFFQPGPGSEIMTRFFSNSGKVAMHIPPGEMDEVRAYMSEQFPRVIILKDTLDQAAFGLTPQPAGK